MSDKPMILSGKPIADIINAKTRELLAKFNLYDPPKLAVLICDDDNANQSYIRSLKKTGNELGINVDEVQGGYPATFDNMIEFVKTVETGYDGFIVLNNTSSRIDYGITHWLDSFHNKFSDVDSVTETNMSLFANGASNMFAPAVALATAALIRYYDLDLTNRPVIIAGRSRHVGEAIATLLLRMDAAISIVHSKCSSHLAREVMNRHNAIVISTIGIREFFTDCFIGKDSALISVGSTFIDGKAWTDFSSGLLKYHDHTPAIGGIGPITSAIIFNKLLWKITNFDLAKWIMEDFPTYDEACAENITQYPSPKSPLNDGTSFSIIHDYTCGNLFVYTMDKKSTMAEISLNVPFLYESNIHITLNQDSCELKLLANDGKTGAYVSWNHDARCLRIRVLKRPGYEGAMFPITIVEYNDYELTK